MFGGSVISALLGAVLVIGIVVCWVGSLVAMLTALGKKRWFWGIPMLFLGPLVALPYSFVDSDADYAKSLIVKGLVVVVLAGAALFVYGFASRP